MKTKKEKEKLWCSEKSLVHLYVIDSSDAKKDSYSFFKQEKKLKYNLTAIADGMKERLLHNPKKNKGFKLAIFYNNQTDKELFRIDNMPKSEPNPAKIKLTIYDKANQRSTYESTQNEDKGSFDFIISAMLKRVCEQEMKKNYRTAIFYDRINDQVLAHHSPSRGFYKK